MNHRNDELTTDHAMAKQAMVEAVTLTVEVNGEDLKVVAGVALTFELPNGDDTTIVISAPMARGMAKLLNNQATRAESAVEPNADLVNGTEAAPVAG